MHPDLQHYLSKLDPETRAIIDILMWQNQSDKKEQSGLQRDILRRFDEHEKMHNSLQGNIESLDIEIKSFARWKLVVTTTLSVIGTMLTLLFASSLPSIVRFFLSL